MSGATLRTRNAGMLAIVAVLVAVASGCDKFARIEVNNHTALALVVTANDRHTVRVEPYSRMYNGPNVNEKLRSISVRFADGPEERVVLEFDTYDDDIVLHVSGPPLEVEVVREKHPSSTRPATPAR